MSSQLKELVVYNSSSGYNAHQTAVLTHAYLPCSCSWQGPFPYKLPAHGLKKNECEYCCTRKARGTRCVKLSCLTFRSRPRNAQVEMYNEEMKDEILVTRRATYKAEEAVSGLENDKGRQDLFIDRLMDQARKAKPTAWLRLRGVGVGAGVVLGAEGTPIPCETCVELTAGYSPTGM